MIKDEAFYLNLAIQQLVPNVGFSFNGADYSTIVWNDTVKKVPTQAEVDAAIAKVKADETAFFAKAEADKEAAQAKLAALGLTADDLKALGL
jgi:hypothetical protein